MRAKPDGTDSPLTSLAANPFVRIPRYRFIDVTRGQQNGVAVGQVHGFGHLCRGHSVRQAVRSAASALSRTRPRACCRASV